MGHINFLIEMEADRKGLPGPRESWRHALTNWGMFASR